MKKILFIAIALILSSCSAMLLQPNETGEISMRTAAPELDEAPAYFRIGGTHESGRTFERTTTGTEILIDDLLPGVWQLTVKGFNSSDQVVAEGTGSLTVESGGSSSIIIVLYSTTGTGALDLRLLWNPDLVLNASLAISMSTLGGAEIDVNCEVLTGEASGLTENLPSGFYRLNVQLYDGAVSVMGSMETVLIREGATTAIDLDYTQINKPGQCLSVNGTEFTIGWDCDDTTVDEYRIYYREHGTWSWILLGSTGSGEILDFTVDTGILDYGVYDFAVSSVAGSEESELHTSMDDTALPATGWYVSWSA